MNLRMTFFATFALAATLLAAAEGEHKLEAVEQAPEGIAAEIAPLLSKTGQQVTGPDGPVATFWLIEKLPVVAGFTPTLNLKYPFEEGQLVGAMSVPKGKKYNDFRGQEIKPGSYTLRYGKQPMDGNHIGTSETYDFILALPAKVDKDPKPYKTVTQLQERSAKASGTSHPAIFSLLPNEAAIEEAKLEHDAGKEFWILDLPAATDGEPATVPIRLVVVGKAEG